MGNTHPERREKSKPTEITISAYRFLDEVHQQGLWRFWQGDNWSYSDPGDRILDQAKIADLARKTLIPYDREPEKKLQLPELEQLQTLAPQLVRFGVDQSVAAGILPRQSAELGFRLTKPEDIQVLSQGRLGMKEGGLNEDMRKNRSSFPDEGGDHLQVWITDATVRNRIIHYQETARVAGVELTPQQLLTAALGSISIHEWAHSLEKALVTRLRQIIQSFPESEELQDDSRISNFVFSFVPRQAANTEPIVNNLGKHATEQTHKERLSTGFEIESIRYFLIKEGLDPESADKVVREIHRERQDVLEEFKILRDKLQMKDGEMETYFFDMRAVLRENDLDEAHIDSLWDCLGYFKGYTPAELKDILHKAQQELNDTQKIRQEVLDIHNQDWSTWN